MTGCSIVARAQSTLRMLFLVGISLCLGLTSRAQSSYPWLWCPTTPTLPPTVKCHERPPMLEGVSFELGCFDICTGVPINCHEDWEEYFSLAGLPQADMLYWQGGHVHARNGSVAATTGGIYSELSGFASTSVIEGDTQNEMWPGFKYRPQASQVVHVTARAKTLTEGYSPVVDWNWHLDPTDNSGKTVILEIAFDVRLGGLVELPSDPLNFVVERQKTATHPQADYVTPVMAARLEKLSVLYRSAYLGCTGGRIGVQLSFNDMSLAWGGLFDINSTWDCPHAWHRVGTSADVNHDGPRDGGGRQATDEDLLDDLARGLHLVRHEKSIGLIHYEFGR